MREAVSLSTSKYKRRTLSIENQFERLQTQWKNGQSGTGAWFWQHFKPILLTVHEGNKELHLQCVHCSKLFSARNPSRTSLEHLKSGACNVFRRTTAYEEVKALPRSTPSGKRGRKAAKISATAGSDAVTRRRNEGLTLSGVDAAPHEDSEAAESLASFFVESGIPISLLRHPRLVEFCSLVGVGLPDPRHLLTGFLDSRFNRIYEENETRLGKAGLFQIAAEGCRSGSSSITINFPEGPPAYLKSVDLRAHESRSLVEVLASTTEELDSIVDRRNCVGWIVNTSSADRGSLAEAEERYPWMVHVTCQAFALRSLMKDLSKHVKMVSETVEMSQRIVRFLRARPAEMASLTRRDASVCLVDSRSEHPLVSGAMALDSVWRSRAPIQAGFLEEPLASEGLGPVASACLDIHFWDCAAAVQSLLHPILVTLQEVERAKPHFSQALDIWLCLEQHFGEWCQRNRDTSAGVMEIFEKRRSKSYHPAMAAAFLLDPGFCVKREDGSFIPDWDRLRPEQQSDVEPVLRRVSAPNRGARAVTDFAQWKFSGLPPEFGSVVSERSQTGESCLSKCVPMALRKTIWMSCLKDFEALGMAAHRLLALKATASSIAPTGALEDTSLSAAALLMQSKLQYVCNNVRLSSNRVIDEKLLDLDLLSELAARSEDISNLPKDDMEIDDDPERAAREEGSQLYMHQLQLSTPPPPVLRMSPPPLGTLPELPLHSLTASASVPSGLPRPDDTSYYVSPSSTGLEQQPTDFTPKTDITETCPK